MSEASLKRIEAEFSAEISTVRTTDDGKALLLRFYARIAQDAADRTFLQSMGLAEAAVATMHHRTLVRLLENVQSAHAEWGLDDETFTDTAMECTGEAFHTRFMELDASRIGGRS
jgi:hypothetical protein